MDDRVTLFARLKREPAMRPVVTVLRPLKRVLLRLIPIVTRRAKWVWWRRLRGLKPIPMSSEEKVETILGYARSHGTTLLVETGTYRGQTVDGCLGHFDRIWTIELDDALHEAARRRFRPWPHVTVVHGDSATSLPAVLAEAEGPTLFWLDAHCSGGITARGEIDTPIWTELTAILERRAPTDVILIDDARDFGKGGYPRVAELEEMIHARRPSWRFEVRDDIIRIHA